jgi:putative MATE family efflux protein
MVVGTTEEDSAAETDAGPSGPPPFAGESISRVVWTLAWPAVALNSLQVVNTLLDRFYIGHLNEAALTAHGAATTVMFMMFSLAVALGTGVTAIASRAFGARNRTEVRRASRQGFRLSVLAGIVLAVVTALFSYPVAVFILPDKATEAAHQMAYFCSAYACGLPAICMIQCLAGALRATGDTKSPMVISSLQIFCHIALNTVLVPRIGLVGAGIALSISAWISALIYVPFVAKTALGPVHHLRLPEKEWIVRILRIAVPAGAMAALRVLSLTAFTLALKLAPNGEAAIAAMGIGFAIESVMFMPSFGLSVAAGALVGQSLGAKDPDRAYRIGWSASHWAGIVTLALAGPIFWAAPWIAHQLLPGKPAVIVEAVSLLRWLCVTEVFFAYSMVMIGALQGAGDTVRPMRIAIAALWGMRVPMAFLLLLPAGYPVLGWHLPIGAGLGAAGAWIAMSFTQVVQGVLSVIAWKRGAWRALKV